MTGSRPTRQLRRDLRRRPGGRLGDSRLNKGKRRGGSVDYSAATIGFSLEQPVDGEPASVGNGVHVCFIAESHAAVDEFYRTALAHGGTDAGPPGLRPEYDANYYGAFVRDPDGNKIEAVCFMAK